MALGIMWRRDPANKEIRKSLKGGAYAIIKRKRWLLGVGTAVCGRNWMCKTTKGGSKKQPVKKQKS